MSATLVGLAVAGFALWGIAAYAKRAKRTRACLVLFVLGSLLMLPAVVQDIGRKFFGFGESSKSIAQPTAVEQTSTLGIKAEEFVDRFNAASKNLGFDVHLKEMTRKRGEKGDTISAAIGPDVGLLGMVEQESNEIAGLMLIFSGGGEHKAMENFACLMEAAVVFIDLCSPGLGPEGRGNVLKECGFLDKDKDDGKCLRGKVEYSNKRSPDVGWWFSVSSL